MTALAALSPRARNQCLLLHAGILSGLLACFAPAARAQVQKGPAPAGTIDLPAIDVQGRRAGVLADTQGFVSRRGMTGAKTDTPLSEVPQSVSVINREQLESRQVQSLGEALRFTPGVQTETFGADPHVDFFSIRGFSTNDAGIYLNGLRVSPGVTALAPGGGADRVERRRAAGP